eukprot:UN18764
MMNKRRYVDRVMNNNQNFYHIENSYKIFEVKLPYLWCLRLVQLFGLFFFRR